MHRAAFDKGYMFVILFIYTVLFINSYIWGFYFYIAQDELVFFSLTVAVQVS